MQSWYDTFVISVAFVAVIMLIAIMAFTILGRAGKRTLKTYSRGRTTSEKIIYMMATFGVFIIIVGFVFGLAILDVISIPIINEPFNITFIVDNVYYVGIFVVIMVLIVTYSCIALHQRSTNFGETLKKEFQLQGKER